MQNLFGIWTSVLMQVDKDRSVGRWASRKWSVGRWSVVGGFNKAHFKGIYFFNRYAALDLAWSAHEYLLGWENLSRKNNSNQTSLP